MRIQFRRGAVHLPELGLWLDAHEPRTGFERVFVSHAHSDHTAPHREVILSEPTAKLMQARIGGGDRLEHRLRFGERTIFRQGIREFAMTLLPAGHIFGSAMSLIEANGERLLYTGDFKLRRGLSAEPCEPRAADVLIMETTFGRPHYVFPPTEAVLKSVIRFCRESLDNDETPVLLGYSLGKSQEIMCGLAEAGLPLMLHGSVYRLTQIYEQFGQCFPKYERYESGAVQGKVLICPPSAANSAMLRKAGRTRTAILTGWAVDPGCRYQYRSDAAFVLSDHADYPDLIEMVKRVGPRKVYTLHGFAAEFAQRLREIGYDAQALSENEQLGLELPIPAGQGKRGPQRETASVPVEGATDNAAAATDLPASDRFSSFAALCAAIGETASKLEKIRRVADYLKGLDPASAAIAVTWLSGRPFASSQNKVLQAGWAVIRDALCAVACIDETQFHQVYLKHSDLGETAFELRANMGRTGMLSIAAVDSLFHAIQSARGPSAKRPLLIAALKQCSALETKFLVKIITGDLRIGLKEGLVEDCVASAFEVTADAVRQGSLLLGDIGETAKLASEGKLGTASLVPFRPIRFMLASPEPTAFDIWDRIHGSARPAEGERAAAALNEDERSVWIEDKYDGIRCQLHKVGGRASLYSRDLKEITATFPELADAAKRYADDFILDGEIVAVSGNSGVILPFSELQKRLGRREPDLFMRDEVPIRLVAFDLLWRGGESLLDAPLAVRRRKLEELGLSESFALARITQARSVDEIEAAFASARGSGNEGLMIKDPASVYMPGRRGLAWLKLKKAMATLDCVVIGAEYGHGKRSKVLSDYTFAVRDDETGELRTIGKAYSGLTDAEIEQLTKHFLRTAIRQRGRYFEVEPDTVLEIAFDRIQPSERHNSGLAMRFPRIARIRGDKTVAEIDTVGAARKLAGLGDPRRQGELKLL